MTLSPQQTRVMAYLCQGKQNKHIAHEMGLSILTVKVHVKFIMRKLGVTNRTQAVLKMINTEAAI